MLNGYKIYQGLFSTALLVYQSVFVTWLMLAQQMSHLFGLDAQMLDCSPMANGNWNSRSPKNVAHLERIGGIPSIPFWKHIFLWFLRFYVKVKKKHWSRCLLQDGITWQQVSDHASWRARSGHAMVAFNEEIWVLAGENSPIGDLARSCDQQCQPPSNGFLPAWFWITMFMGLAISIHLEAVKGRWVTIRHPIKDQGGVLKN